ncbi:MAG: GNAT family N-acetyltransferase [Pirellulales bacterium]|nr:GNAT family N-acetyltransferase [Pirellulales bacterium]
MSGASWTIRPAEPSDAADIVSIIREAFPARLLDLFVYGCIGIKEFIVEQIGVQNLGGDTSYTVAVTDGKVVACTEVRRLPHCLFLNYIAVIAPFRSQGLGGHLMHKALVEDNPTKVEEIALDVLEFNTNAFHWYEQLGFEHRETIAWWQAALEDGRLSPIVLTGYAQAQACHREFGFSNFTVHAGEKPYEVGRLGEHWYRLTNPEALTAPGLVAGLRRLAPHRRLLLLSKPDSMNISLPDAREVTRTHRLVVAWDVLRHRLKQS